MDSGKLIQESWFYTDSGDKTRLNWFAYEFACVFLENMSRSRKKAIVKWMAARSDEQVAEFCAYFSKRMRLSFLNKLLGNTEAIDVHGEYASDYCHTNTREENDAIIDVAADAWAELAGFCAACPDACLVGCDSACGFFDRQGRGGHCPH